MRFHEYIDCVRWHVLIEIIAVLLNLNHAPVIQAIHGSNRIWNYKQIKDSSVCRRCWCIWDREGQYNLTACHSVIFELSSAYNRLELVMSPEKTKYMVFTMKYQILRIRLHIKNNELNKVNCFK